MGNVAQQTNDAGVGHVAGDGATVVVGLDAVGGAPLGDGAMGTATTAVEAQDEVDDDAGRGENGAKEAEGDEAVGVLVDGRVVEAAHRRLCQRETHRRLC